MSQLSVGQLKYQNYECYRLDISPIAFFYFLSSFLYLVIPPEMGANSCSTYRHRDSLKGSTWGADVTLIQKTRPSPLRHMPTAPPPPRRDRGLLTNPHNSQQPPVYPKIKAGVSRSRRASRLSLFSLTLPKRIEALCQKPSWPNPQNN